MRADICSSEFYKNTTLTATLQHEYSFRMKKHKIIIEKRSRAQGIQIFGNEALSLIENKPLRIVCGEN